LKHAQWFGAIDIFPSAFEIEAIAEDWTRLSRSVKQWM
jgi:hypothetical protein